MSNESESAEGHEVEQEGAFERRPLEIPRGTVFEVELPEPDVMAQLQRGLERSGMAFGECSFCGRPYGSRDGSPLCPPCKGVAAYDGWHERYPERSPFVQRSRLLSLLLLRGSERLAIEGLANESAEAGQSDDLLMCEAALDGDEEAWKSALLSELLLRCPSLRGVVEKVTSEVHVEVTACL